MSDYYILDEDRNFLPDMVYSRSDLKQFSPYR